MIRNASFIERGNPRPHKLTDAERIRRSPGNLRSPQVIGYKIKRSILEKPWQATRYRAAICEESVATAETSAAPLIKSPSSQNQKLKYRSSHSPLALVPSLASLTWRMSLA
jgi:hypothetical protein